MMLRIGRKSQRKSRAFTFLELVLVAAIILILAGLLPPFFRNSYTSIQLRNTGQKLLQLVRYAQAKAISERRLCRINFDFQDNSFWMTAQDETQGEFARLKEKWGKTFKAADGIFINSESLKDEAAFITFYPDASIEQATIEISDHKGNTLTIATQGTLGYVEVQE